jgi:hypothetical protein
MGAPFISTDELSDALGGTDATTTRGTAVITAACDMVRLFTEQELYPAVTAGTVLLDGTGTETLLLPQRPATNAGTVIEAGGTLTLDTDYTLGTDGVLYRTPGVIDAGWGTETLRTYWWPGRQNIEVTYSYGYTSLTMPAELKEVALGMAGRLFVQQPVSGNISESEESLGQYSTRTRYSTNGAGSDFSNTEKAIMRKYKQAKK